MDSYDSKTLVAVSILCARLDMDDVLQALNINVPYIGGGEISEFHRHHVDEIWEHMLLYHPQWWEFALGLREDKTPRIERGVERLRNGRLCEWMWMSDEEVGMETLMRTFERMTDIGGSWEGSWVDEGEVYRRGEDVIDQGPEGEYVVGRVRSALDDEAFRAEVDEERRREIERYEDGWL